MKIPTRKAFKVLSNDASTYLIGANPRKFLSINLQFLEESSFFVVKCNELC